MNELHLLTSTLVLLGAGLFGSIGARAMRTTPILGYFLAGILIGPHGFGLLSEGDTLTFLAELGVVFLLFDVGLHFSLKSLWKTRRDFLGLAPLSLVFTLVPFLCILRLLQLEWPLAVLLSLSFSLSSTAVALKMLTEKGEAHAPLGRVATAILIIQDLIAIALLVAANVFRSGDTDLAGALTLALMKAVVAIGAVAILGRVLRPWLSWTVSRGGEEIFTASALFIVFFTAGATGVMGLSLPLGAFLGGLILSESEYCYLMKTEIRPFRGLLLGLFFISVGMTLVPNIIADHWIIITALTMVMLLSKIVGVFFASQLTGRCNPFSMRLAFLLAPGSEFALVILTVLGEAVLPDTLRGTIAPAVVLTMAGSALLSPVDEYLSRRFQDVLPKEVSEERVHDSRVIVGRINEVTKEIVRALDGLGVLYVLLDTDHQLIARLRADGYSVSFGSFQELSILEAAGIDQARALVYATRDDMNMRAVTAHLLQKHPLLQIQRYDEAIDEPEKVAISTLIALGLDESEVTRFFAQDLPSEFERADKSHQLFT